MDTQATKIVEEVTRKLLEAGGSDLRLLVLYGSQVRGEATPESDIDILVVTNTDNPAVTRRLRDAAYDAMWEHDFARFISLHVMTSPQYEGQKLEGYSFILNVEAEGKVLWPAA